MLYHLLWTLTLYFNPRTHNSFKSILLPYPSILNILTLFHMNAESPLYDSARVRRMQSHTAIGAGAKKPSAADSFPVRSQP